MRSEFEIINNNEVGQTKYLVAVDLLDVDFIVRF